MILRRGIDTKSAKILPNFSPDVAYSFTFGKTSNGGWFVIDRGIDSDSYRSEITFAGASADMFDLHEWLVGAGSDPAVFVTLENNELIFGPNIYAQEYPCAVKSYSDLRQRTLTTWTFSVVLVCGELPVASIGPTLPAVLYPENGVVINAENGNTAQQMGGVYNSGLGSPVATYSTNRDRAICSFSVSMGTTDAGSLLMYHAANKRGEVIDEFTAPTLSGVPEPFGSSYSYPCAIRILSISGLQQYTPNRWRMRLTIGRDV
jgi:hypothetical protein